MIVAFVLANYKLHAKKHARIAELQLENQGLARQNRDDDVDTLRNFLLRVWRLNPAPIGRHIASEIVAQELGWDIECFNAAAMRAAGNFGTLRSAFDGRTFLLQGIPI
jgi:hypothetical protein